MERGTKVGITIESTDKASANFAKLGTAMDKTAVKATTLGSKFSQAFKGLGSNLPPLVMNLDKVTGATDRTIGALGKLGAAAIAQQRSLNALKTIYGTNADEIIRYSKTIADNSNFLSANAQAGAVTAGTLYRNFNITTAGIEKLIAASADLAEMYQIDLNDALTRTSAAIRGEAESVELLGITLNENFVIAQAASRGMEGWTTTMTEAEKAQFRLTLLLEQAAFAHGTAQKAAEGSRGSVANLNEIYAVSTQNLGAMAGALGVAAASASDASITLALVGEQVVNVGKYLKESGAAAKLFAVALNPVTIGLTAVAAITALVVKAKVDEDQKNNDLIESYKKLTEAQRENLTVNQQGAAEDTRFDFPLDKQIQYYKDKFGFEANFTGVLTTAMQKYIMTAEEQIAANDAMSASFYRLDDAGKDAAIGAFAKLETAAENFTTRSDLIGKGLEAMNRILALTGKEFDATKQEVVDLLDELARGEITPGQFSQAMINMDRDIVSVTKSLNDSTTALKSWNTAAKMITEGVISFPPVADSNTAALTEIYNANKERIDAEEKDREEAQANAEARAREFTSNLREQNQKRKDDAIDAIREEYENRRSMLIGLVNEQISAEEQVAEATAQAAEDRQQVQEDYYETTSDLAEDYADRLKEIDKQLASDTKDINKSIEDNQKDHIKALQDLDKERVDIARETEEALADLAVRRTEIQIDAQEALADAESDWMQTAKDNSEALADVRRTLQENTQDAASRWREIVREHKQELQDIKNDLRDAEQDINQDYSRDREDFATRSQRLVEDYTLDMADPNLSEEDRARIQLDYERDIQDLQTDMQRAQEDFDEAHADAVKAAHDAEKTARDDQKQAAADYREEIAGFKKDSQEAIAAIRETQSQAFDDYQEQIDDIKSDELSNLQDIQSERDSIMADQAEKYRTLETERRDLARETGIVERDLIHDRELAERTAMQTRKQEESDYREAITDATEAMRERLAGLVADESAAQTELNELVEGGYLTREQANGLITIGTGLIKDQKTEQANQLISLLNLKGGTEEVLDVEDLRLQKNRDINAEIAAPKSIDLKTGLFDVKLDDAIKRGEAFATMTFTAGLDADSTWLTDSIRNATAEGQAFDDLKFTTMLDAEYPWLTDAITSATAEAQAFDDLKFTTMLDAEYPWLTDAITDATAEAQAFDDLKFTTMLDAEYPYLIDSIEAAETDELDVFADKIWVTSLSAKQVDGFDRIIETAEDKLDTYADKIWAASLSVKAVSGMSTIIETAEKGLNEYSDTIWVTSLSAKPIDGLDKVILSAEDKLDDYANKIWVASLSAKQVANIDTLLSLYTKKLKSVTEDKTYFSSVSVKLSGSYTSDFEAIKARIETDVKAIKSAVTVRVKEGLTDEERLAQPPRQIKPPKEKGTLPERAIGGPGGGRWIMAGEYGPEAIWAPTGSMVMSAGATESRMMQGYAIGGYVEGMSFEQWVRATTNLNFNQLGPNQKDRLREDFQASRTLYATTTGIHVGQGGSSGGSGAAVDTRSSEMSMDKKKKKKKKGGGGGGGSLSFNDQWKAFLNDLKKDPRTQNEYAWLKWKMQQPGDEGLTHAEKAGLMDRSLKLVSNNNGQFKIVPRDHPDDSEIPKDLLPNNPPSGNNPNPPPAPPVTPSPPPLPPPPPFTGPLFPTTIDTDYISSVGGIAGTLDSGAQGGAANSTPLGQRGRAKGSGSPIPRRKGGLPTIQSTREEDNIDKQTAAQFGAMFGKANDTPLAGAVKSLKQGIDNLSRKLEESGGRSGLNNYGTLYVTQGQTQRLSSSDAATLNRV